MLKPVFLSLGIESFLWFTASSKNFLTKYSSHIYNEKWDDIVVDFKESFSKVSEDEKVMLKNNFTYSRDIAFNRIKQLHKEIQDLENELKAWFLNRWKLRLNKQLLSKLKHFRTEYNMLNNPFYKAVKYEGFDIVSMFPSYTFQAEYPAYV